MRFVTFQRDLPHAEAGVLLRDEVISLHRAGFDDLTAMIAGGADARDRVLRWVHRATAGDVAPATKVKLLPPLPRPAKIVCAGLTWANGAETDMEAPAVPVVLPKLSCAVAGPDEAVVLPPDCRDARCEAHLAVIIGRRCRRVPPERWHDCVFGYTLVNNVSAGILLGNSCDTFAPTGPWIVTPDELPDPQALELSLTLDGELLRRGRTSELVFGLAELMARVSEVCALEPGDVISSGLAAGAGFTRTPPRFLTRGDEVVVQAEGIGALRNRVE